MYAQQVSFPKRVAAIVAAFAMVFMMLAAFQVATAKPASAATPTCYLDSVTGTIICTGDYTSDNGGGQGSTSTGAVGGGSTTTVGDPNISHRGPYDSICFYHSGTPIYPDGTTDVYPVRSKTATCNTGETGRACAFNTYSIAGYQVTSCDIPSVCNAVNGHPATTVRVFITDNKSTKKTTIKGVCVYPTQAPVPYITTGYCATSAITYLYYSTSASTINTGSSGSAASAPIKSGSLGSGTLVDTSSTTTIPLNASNWATYVATCKPGAAPQRVDFTKDTVNGGTVLGYYRSTQKITYVTCTISIWPTWTKKANDVTCPSSPKTPVYVHGRYTNTCLNGAVSGVHTDLAKYFQPANCAGENFTVKCTVADTKINGSTTSTSVTRTGQDIAVIYGAAQITGNGVKNVTNIKRSSSVVDGSTPYYSSDPNDAKQYFKLYTANHTQIKFDKYYLVASIGNNDSIQYYWASDSGSPWSMVTTYTYHGFFKSVESTGSVTSSTKTTLWVEDDATCGDTAKSAKVNVLRSVNTN